jgi:hypothetical protein
MEDGDLDLSEDLEDLARISFVLSAMYSVAGLIEVLGILSGATQKISLVRLYTILSFLAAFLITCAGLINMTAYFALRDDLIKECKSLAMDGETFIRSTFRNGDWPANNMGDDALSANTAAISCLEAWTNNANSQVFSGLMLHHLLPASVIFLAAIAYYRQITDPVHPAARAASTNVQMNAYPQSHYSPLYNGSAAPHYTDRDNNPGNNNNNNNNNNGNGNGDGDINNNHLRVPRAQGTGAARGATVVSPRRSHVPSPLGRNTASGVGPDGMFAIGSASDVDSPAPGPPSFTTSIAGYQYGGLPPYTPGLDEDRGRR